MASFACCFDGVAALSRRRGEIPAVASAPAPCKSVGEPIDLGDIEVSEASTMPPSPGGSLPGVLSVLVLPWQEASLSSFLGSGDLARLSVGCAALLSELTVEVDDGDGSEGAVPQRLLVVPVVDLNMNTVEAELQKVSLLHARTVRVDSRLSLNALASVVRDGHRQLRQLERFSLKGCGFHANDVKELLEPILAHTRSLKLLNLERNRVSCDAVQALARSEMLSRVETLNLRYNNVADTGAIALAESPYIKFVHVLNLKQNRVTDKGAKALASMLADNDTMRNLNMRRQTPPLSDKSALAFAEMLKTNSGLQLLRLRRNRIGDLGATALAEASAERLARLSAVRALDEEVRLELDLEENRVKDAGGLALMRMAAAAPLRVQLEVLLHSNHVTSESLRAAAIDAGEASELEASGTRVSFVNKPEFQL